MDIEARARVFWYIVLAVTASGCGGPSESAHRGLTGVYMELRHAPAPSTGPSSGPGPYGV